MLLIDSLIKQAENRFVTISFVKKDGSLRTINGRFGVTKHLKGGTCSLDKNKFFIIYSIADAGYRAIDKQKIKSIMMDGMAIYKAD